MMETASTQIRRLLGIYAALMGLLALTACAMLLPASSWTILISLTIAMAKTFLIFVFFMQLRLAPGLLRLCACVGFAWLAIALSLVFADYMTRG